MANPILFGKYHLIEKISAGGMAEVYKAKSYGVAGFEKILVIKKILPHLTSDEDFVRMFLDEARISVSLSHGNIVQVIDLGKEGETYFMAMEFVHGYDLARTLVRSKQTEDIPPPLCLYILCEVLKALDYAHRRKDRSQQDLNIVHCDVSPQNVLLSFEGEVKLTDFGISRAAFQSASSQGVVRGKYAYMSPEQVEGRALDRRSDIFSVGIILWEILTHRRLFKTDNVEKTLRKVLSAPIPTPSSIVSDVHPELDRITLKALARKREERYQEDQEMLEDLSAFMFSQGMHVAATDLAEYLRRVFIKELQRAKGDDLGFGVRTGDSKEGATGRRSTMFIPVGSGRAIPSFQPADEMVQAASLSRIGVAVLCAEWNQSQGNRGQSGEQAKLVRDLVGRLEKSIERTGGELWEVNHNSLIGTWRIAEDPSGTAAQALECAASLKFDFEAVLEKDSGTWSIDAAFHVGSVLVEKRSGNPLFGWQITKTFALARLMVNLSGGQGKVLVSERGRQLGADLFGFEPHALRGKLPAELARVYVLVPLDRTSAEARPKFAFYTRYLGRESMLASLVDRLREAGDGKPSVVLLLGDEGTGKSRLREEFKQSCRKLGAGFFLGTAQKETRHFSYFTFLGALRKICGMTPPESAEDERRKLSRLIQLGLSQEDLELVHSLFDEPAILFGQALDSSRQSCIWALFDKLLAGLAKDAPLVLAFEEFQWADSLTEDYIAHLVTRLSNQKLILILEASSDYSRPWLDSAPTTIHDFKAIPVSLTEEMVRDMLGVSEVSRDLLQTIATLSWGVPLYIKELVGLLMDEGSIEFNGQKAELSATGKGVSLPRTPYELLARRFARVPEDVRALLKAGAIVGGQFPVSVVEQLLPLESGVRETLQKAVVAGMLKERLVGTTTYFRFRHSHYRWLASNQPAGAANAQLERRLAENLPIWTPLGRGNLIEQVARSSYAARAPEAFQALEKAGDKLLFEHGIASSLVFYRRALEMLRTESAARDEHRRRIRWKIAGTLLHHGMLTDSEDLLHEWLESARRSGMEFQAIGLMIDLSQQYAVRGDLDQAVRVLREAQKISRRGASQLQMAEVEQELGHVLMIQGKCEEAMQYLHGAYQRAKGLGERTAILSHALSLGRFYHHVGLYSKALESYRKVVGAARDQNNTNLLMSSLILLGDLHRDLKRDKISVQCYREALVLARSLDDKAAQSRVLGDIGGLCLEEGVPQRAFPYLKAAVDLSSSMNRPELTTVQRLYLAYLKALLGDPKAGLKEIQSVMSKPETGRLRFVVARAHLLSGRCQLLMRENKRARESFERCLNVASDLKSAPLTRLATAALGSIPATMIGIPVYDPGTGPLGGTS